MADMINSESYETLTPSRKSERSEHQNRPGSLSASSVAYANTLKQK